jgi:hypothetical protein
MSHSNSHEKKKKEEEEEEEEEEEGRRTRAWLIALASAQSSDIGYLRFFEYGLL